MILEKLSVSKYSFKWQCNIFFVNYNKISMYIIWVHLFFGVVWMCMLRRHFYLACLPLYHNSTILQPMETRITKYHGAHIGSQDPHCTLFIKKKYYKKTGHFQLYLSFHLIYHCVPIKYLFLQNLTKKLWYTGSLKWYFFICFQSFHILICSQFFLVFDK